MQRHTHKLSRFAGFATIMAIWGVAAGLSIVSLLATAAPDSVPQKPSAQVSASAQGPAAGATQTGKASFYSTRYAGKSMADGTPMHLYANNAASLTLPLGTSARVTDLETGRSAVVVIRDRGPYVKGRIIDLSPATAHQIGLTAREGLALVRVAVLSLPHDRIAMARPAGGATGRRGSNQQSVTLDE